MSNLQRRHRNKIDFGTPEYYLNFKALHPNVRISQQMHTNVIKAYMGIVLKKIVHEMLRFNWPGLGLFYLTKEKPKIVHKDGVPKILAPVNWLETKRIRLLTGDPDRKVYHLNTHTHGYIYKVKWDRNSNAFVNNKFYSFVVATSVKKYLSKSIQENVKPINAYAP